MRLLLVTLLRAGLRDWLLWLSIPCTSSSLSSAYLYLSVQSSLSLSLGFIRLENLLSTHLSSRQTAWNLDSPRTSPFPSRTTSRSRSFQSSGWFPSRRWWRRTFWRSRSRRCICIWMTQSMTYHFLTQRGSCESPGSLYVVFRESDWFWWDWGLVCIGWRCIIG